MLTQALRSKIDVLWDKFWSGELGASFIRCVQCFGEVTETSMARANFMELRQACPADVFCVTTSRMEGTACN